MNLDTIAMLLGYTCLGIGSFILLIVVAMVIVDALFEGF